MTADERFDALEALFPFTDFPVRKSRTSPLLANGAFDGPNGPVVTAAITTGAGCHGPVDRAILDPAAAGLRHPSVVRRTMLALPDGQGRRRIGYRRAADRARPVARSAAILHA